jgi:hypothetical protein
MAPKSDALRREALGLPDAERADLAAELLISLEAPDEDPTLVKSLWGAEIERRARQVIAGDAQSQDWSIVRERLTDAPDESRATSASSTRPPPKLSGSFRTVR